MWFLGRAARSHAFRAAGALVASGPSPADVRACPVTLFSPVGLGLPKSHTRSHSAFVPSLGMCDLRVSR